jgi:hypothetical protein
MLKINQEFSTIITLADAPASVQEALRNLVGLNYFNCRGNFIHIDDETIRVVNPLNGGFKTEHKTVEAALENYFDDAEAELRRMNDYVVSLGKALTLVSSSDTIIQNFQLVANGEGIYTEQVLVEALTDDMKFFAVVDVGHRLVKKYNKLVSLQAIRTAGNLSK